MAQETSKPAQSDEPDDPQDVGKVAPAQTGKALSGDATLANVPDEAASLEELVQQPRKVTVATAVEGDEASKVTDVVRKSPVGCPLGWLGVALGVLLGVVASGVGFLWINQAQMLDVPGLDGYGPDRSGPEMSVQDTQSTRQTGVLVAQEGLISPPPLCDLDALPAAETLFTTSGRRVLITALAQNPAQIKERGRNNVSSGGLAEPLVSSSISPPQTATPIIAYGALPCALVGGPEDLHLQRFDLGAERAAYLARFFKADVVLWGEIAADGTQHYVLTHPLGRDRYSFRHRSLLLSAGLLNAGDDANHPGRMLLEATLLASAHFLADPSGISSEAVRDLSAGLIGHLDEAALSQSAKWQIQRVLGDLHAIAGLVAQDEATLEMAVTFYQDALGVVDRLATPIAWRQIQSDLGQTLESIGVRYGRMQAVGTALDAYQAALSETTMGSARFEWARLRAGIGGILVVMAQQEEGTSRLTAAIDAYQDALSVHKPGDTPVQWGALHHNLGSVYQILAQRTSQPDWFRRAAEAYDLALQVTEFEQDPDAYSINQISRGAALTALGLRTRSAAPLREAVMAYRAALEAFDAMKGSDPVTPAGVARLAASQASVQHSLGNSLVTLADFEDRSANLTAAIAAYRAGGAYYDADTQPLRWAVNRNNLANALRLLGKADASTPEARQALLREAIALYEEVLPILSERASSHADSVVQNLADAQQQLAKLRE